jgi:hypothetical protein
MSMYQTHRARISAFLLVFACWSFPEAIAAEQEQLPLGKYAVYMFDPYGNARYAFDFELLTVPSNGKLGRYELQMGHVASGEREKWQGDYEYDATARRVRWRSGPFARSELYRQDAKNPDGGKVVTNGGRWTVFLNNKVRGTSAKQ